MLFRNELHLSELDCPHRTRSNIAHLPAPHQVMQGLHCLLYGSIGVKAVNLKKVDVIRL